MKISDVIWRGLHEHPNPTLITMCQHDLLLLLSEPDILSRIETTEAIEWIYEGVPIVTDDSAPGAITIS